MSRAHKHYFIIAWIALLITYVLALSGFNILCMRGMVLPYIIFFYLFAYYFHKTPKRLKTFVIVTMVTTSIVGIPRDVATYMRSSIGGNTLTYKAFPSLKNTVSNKVSKDVARLSSDPELVQKVKTSTDEILRAITPYQSEQFRHIPYSKLNTYELEALRFKTKNESHPLSPSVL
jgi:hypothetical protein